MPSLFVRALLIAASAASLAACATPRYAVSTSDHGGGSQNRPYIDPNLRGTMKPYEVNGVWYTPKEQPGYEETGMASWYGEQFHHRTTADGENFDMDAISAAHKTLPLPSLVEVTNLDNGRTIIVRVNDRGPFVDGRIIDLSKGAAEQLGFRDKGLARVRVRYVGPAQGISVQQQIAQETGYTDNTAPPPATAQIDYTKAPASMPPANQPSIVQADLPPPPAARVPAVIQSAPAPAMTAGPVWRVQAGAFSTRANADRAAARFTNAHVEPMDRGGVTLWRVILGPANDVAGADALRDQAAAAGFPDATVLGPL